jgi:hypothetical protein
MLIQKINGESPSSLATKTNNDGVNNLLTNALNAQKAKTNKRGHGMCSIM